MGVEGSARYLLLLGWKVRAVLLKWSHAAANVQPVVVRFTNVSSAATGQESCDIVRLLE